MTHRTHFLDDNELGVDEAQIVPLVNSQMDALFLGGLGTDINLMDDISGFTHGQGGTIAQRHTTSNPLDSSMGQYELTAPVDQPVIDVLWRQDVIGTTNSTGGSSRGFAVRVENTAGTTLIIHFAAGKIQIAIPGGTLFNWLLADGTLTSNHNLADTTRFVIDQWYQLQVRWLSNTTYDIWMAPAGSALVKQNLNPLTVRDVAQSDLALVGNLRLNGNAWFDNFEFGTVPPQGLLLAA